MDEIEEFERAVDANGYRSRDTYTEKEYERTKSALYEKMMEAERYKVALHRIIGNGDATGCNPQLMVKVAQQALSKANQQTL